LHIVAIQIGTSGNGEVTGISLEILDSVGYFLWGRDGAFESSIDNIGGHSKSR